MIVFQTFIMIADRSVRLIACKWPYGAWAMALTQSPISRNSPMRLLDAAKE